MDSRFQTDGISLYQGDALRVLTTLPVASVDAVLTDPPYSSGGIKHTATFGTAPLGVFGRLKRQIRKGS